VRRLFRLGFLAVLACSSSAATTIAVTLGGETDTVSRSPAVASYIIEAVDQQGNRQTLADGGWVPDSTVQLTDLDQTVVASIQLTAFEAQGSPVVWGAVPFEQLGVFDGVTVPLFIQRKGENARMPGDADDQGQPLLATSSSVIYVAGDNHDLVAYDMLMLDFFGRCPLVAGAKSFAVVVSPDPNSDDEYAMAWRVDNDAASIVGLGQCTTGYEKFVQLDAASGSFSWGDFAGGRTVMGDDGSAYIVGPSRLSAPSGTVFKIAPDNDASLVNASITSTALAARQGAATAWAPTRGVFIYGGSTSSTKAGELVSPSGSVTEIDGNETREDLAAIAFDSKTMLLAGDDQVPTLVDLSCSSCPTQSWGVALPVKLSSPSLFSLGNGAFLIVGDDSTGATRVLRMSASATVEKPLKITRHGARAIQFETGQIVIIGGGNATPESYVD
jgi:hypothetical protein